MIMLANGYCILGNLCLIEVDSHANDDEDACLLDVWYRLRLSRHLT